MVFDEKSLGHKNLSSKKPLQTSHKNGNNTIYTHDFSQNRDLRTPTNGRTDKNFEIMLQKVQVTKP